MRRLETIELFKAGARITANGNVVFNQMDGPTDRCHGQHKVIAALTVPDEPADGVQGDLLIH